jgi:hypothetical protein
LNAIILKYGELLFVPITDEYGNEGYIEKTNKEPSFNEIQELISSLSDDLSVTFFDSNYPRISDPGAYVTISKYNYKYICTVGNHGWQNNPYYISTKEAASYLLKNWNDNKNSRIIRFDSQEQIRSIKIAKYYFNQLKLVRKTKKYDIYELNGQYVIKTRFLWKFQKIDLYIFDQSPELLATDNDIKMFVTKPIKVSFIDQCLHFILCFINYFRI